MIEEDRAANYENLLDSALATLGVLLRQAPPLGFGKSEAEIEEFLGPELYELRKQRMGLAAKAESRLRR
jgi:hypothetical protein